MSKMTHRLRLSFALVAAVGLTSVFPSLTPPLASTALAAAPATMQQHEFVLDARGLSPRPARVTVAGTFNGWNRDATPMVNDGTGVFRVRVPLEDGVHFYKFVADGDRWLNDPRSDRDLEEPDGHGGVNSALLIGPDARKLPPPPQEAVNADAVRHDPSNVQDLNVYADGLARVSVRTQRQDIAGAAALVIEGGAVAGRFPLHHADTTMGFDRRTGAVRFPAGDELRYVIELRDGNYTGYLTGGGDVVPELEAAVRRPITASATPAFETPDWAKHAVWYQIFPERFRNGERANDPGDKDYETLIDWRANWWETQPGEAPGMHNFYRGAGNVWQRRYGGDFQGLREALPYLRELGVNAIYLNPVFEADSMHKYDTSDFRHIDDNFGIKGDVERLAARGVETDDPATWTWTESDKLFLDFIQEAHRQGFKVVIDGVFNHVGRSHPFFQDVVKNGRNSKYADWFEIEAFADQHPADPAQFGQPGGLRFKAWDGPSGHLPAFKKDPVTGLAKGPYEHVMAITKRWLAPDGDPSKGIDGWRLDVANDIPHPFWIEWRKLVKETKPDAYISGEIWSMAQPWLQGDQFDAVMNYQWAMPAQRFFINQEQATTPSQFSAEWSRVFNAYPMQVSLVLMNLYDSHDTDRLASMFVNPDVPYDGANRIQDNGPNYSPAKPTPEQYTRMKQAVTAQMTVLGAPMIYYGNETGMWSPDDPSNRQPMVWKEMLPYADPEIEFNQPLFDHFQRLIAVRRALPVIREGYQHTVLADDQRGVLVYARGLGEDIAYVAINRSNRPVSVEVTVDDARPLVDWLDPQNVTIDDDITDQGPADRPAAQVREGAKALTPRDGRITVDLPAWGSAVLAPTPQ